MANPRPLRSWIFEPWLREPKHPHSDETNNTLKKFTSTRIYHRRSRQSRNRSQRARQVRRSTFRCQQRGRDISDYITPNIACPCAINMVNVHRKMLLGTAFVYSYVAAWFRLDILLWSQSANWISLLCTRYRLEYGIDAWCMAAAGICDAGRCMQWVLAALALPRFLACHVLSQQVKLTMRSSISVSTQHLSCHLSFKNDCSCQCEILHLLALAGLLGSALCRGK